MKRAILAAILGTAALAIAQGTPSQATPPKGTDNDTKDTGGKKQTEPTPGGTSRPGPGTDNAAPQSAGSHSVGVKQRDAGSLGTDNDPKGNAPKK